MGDGPALGEADVWGGVDDEAALERYRALAGIVDDGIYQLDADGRFVAVNDVVVRETGYPRDDLLGEHVSLVIDEEDCGRIEHEIARLLDAGERRSRVLDATVHAADGEPIPCEIRVAPLVDDGEFQGTVGVVEEIRERDRRRRRRERELEQYRALTEAANDVIVTIDEDSTIQTVNPAAEDVFGYDPAELVGESLTTLMPDELVDEHVTALDRYLETGERTLDWDYVELPGVRADGTAVPLAVSFSEVEHEDERYFTGIVRDVTVRTERERELEETRRRYRTLVEHFPNGAVALVDEDLRYVTFGGTPSGGWDVTREDLEGARLRDALPAELADVVVPRYEDALEDESSQFEATVGERVYRFQFIPVRDDEGAVVAALGMSQDVTDRKAYERELQRYERILETIDDGVYVLDGDNRFLLVNDAFAEMVGTDRDALVGEHASTAFHEGAVARSERLQREIREGETDVGELEEDLKTGDGDVPVVTRLRPFETGGEYGRVGVVRDVTERKARERELERRARQQQVVADLGQFALQTDDLDELMREAAAQVADVLDNEYCKVLDLDSDERELLLRQGVGWDEGIVGDATVDADENSQAGYTLLSEEPVVVEDLDSETRFAGPDLLTSHDVTSGISTIVGSVDDPWGILGTHDTDRREFTEEDVNFVKSVANVLAEAIERQQYRAELEKLVADLEESNERLEQFAYAASHDLQEPLRMVSSYLSLLERRYTDDLDDDAEEFIDFAVDGAQRMREMIDGLLEYSRVETRGDPFEPVDLDAVLDDVVTDLQFRIEETDATVTRDSLPVVDGDRDQLRRVFQNLLDNALQYSGDGPPRVHVDARRDGGEWIVSVSDEGIGIDPDESDRVFQVFQRLHSREEHAGTGIGLALCRRIVERHGGEIWAESEPGEGTTFSFRLPAADGTDR